jgi:hypothetical protein
MIGPEPPPDCHSLWLTPPLEYTSKLMPWSIRPPNSAFTKEYR